MAMKSWFKPSKTSRLQTAVLEDDHKEVTKALHDGADPDTSIPCEFPESWGGTLNSVPIITVAAYKGYGEVVSALLETKVDIERKCDFTLSPLGTAVVWGHTLIAKKLLQNGADPEICIPWEFPGEWGGKYERVPILTVAADKGYVDVVSALLEKDIDIEARGDYIMSALAKAVYEGHIQITEQLLNKGADINSKDKQYGEMPMHAAAYSGFVQIAELLQSRGSSLETVNWYGLTPLHYAGWGGMKSTAEWLVEQGVKVNTVDRYNRTAADYAEQERHTNLASWLRRPEHQPMASMSKIKIQDEIYDDWENYATTSIEDSSQHLDEMQKMNIPDSYDEALVGSDSSSDEEEFQHDGYFDEEENKLCKIFPNVDLQTIKSTIHISSGNVELASARIRGNFEMNSEGLTNEKTNGRVVILNYTKFTNGIEKRQGSNKDSDNLYQVFTHLGYKVEIHKNRYKNGTENILRKLQSDTTSESLILIILSHGMNKYCFYTSDGSYMDLDEIRKKFTDTACPGLKGKSKIILSNFCRGKLIEYQTDAAGFVEVPHNMVTIHATVENIKAMRHPRRGTIFISSLCKVLKKDQRLQEMYNDLAKKMKEEGGTTPMMEVFAPFPEFIF